MRLKASAIIIGNEILNGKVQDSNSIILAQTLFNCGVKLVRIETIPDQLEIMVKTFQEHARQFDLVFSSGGIGSTHDDLTYQAIAQAFKQKLEIHPEALKRYVAFYETKPDPAREKMLRLPNQAEILWEPQLWVPIVHIKPIYVLPGIPELFVQTLKAIQNRFTYQPFERALVYSHKEEGDLAFQLEEVQNRFPELEIGSYPLKRGLEHQVMFSIEGENKAAVQEAELLISRFA